MNTQSSEVTFYTSFEADPGLVDALSGVRQQEIASPRPWRRRLFSWPWRPWHNERVCELVYTGFRIEPDTVTTSTRRGRKEA